MKVSDLQEIERGLLGCLLHSDRAFDEVAGIIRQEYFYMPVHARIFEAIRARCETGQSVSVSLIAPLFQNDPDLIDAGGGDYLRSIVDSVISPRNALDYAKTIKNEHCRRAAAFIAEEIRERVERPEFSAVEDLQAIENMTFSLTDGLSLEGSFASVRPDLSSSVAKALTNMQLAQTGEYGLKTGIGKLDNHLKGLKGGRLYIAAGRPGMGKTAFGITIAANAALVGKRVLFYSIEMNDSDLTQRIIARLSGVSVDQLNVPFPLSAQQVQAVTAAADKICNIPLHIDHSQSLTVTDVFSRSRRYKRRHGLDLIIVDYLGLMRPEDKYANKVHQIEEITTGLKRIASTLGVPVLLLAQLNRAVENRDNKRPHLSDLRDSGAIEQDADVVMLLYREEYYLEREKPEIMPKFSASHKNKKEAEHLANVAASRGKAEIIIAKNRQGRICTLDVKFNGDGQAFHE